MISKEFEQSGDAIQRHVLPSKSNLQLSELKPGGDHQASKIKKLLDEDTYVESLEKIIERDFFPQCARFRNAIENSDQKDSETMQRIIQTPFSEADDSISHHQSIISEPQSSDTVDIDNMRLDSFTNKYTSEDNFSFEELHKRDQEEKQRKFHWLYEPIDGKIAGSLMLYHMGGKTLSVADRQKMDAILDSAENEVSEYYKDTRPTKPDMWTYRVRNQLMFPVDLAASREICEVDKKNKDQGKVLQLESVPGTTSCPDGILTMEDKDRDQQERRSSTSSTEELSVGVTASDTAPVHPSATASFSSCGRVLRGSERETGTEETPIQTEMSNPLVGLMPPPEKRIQYHNTRLSRSFLRNMEETTGLGGASSSARRTGSGPSPLEPPHTPSVLSSAGDQGTETGTGSTRGGAVAQNMDGAYRFVSMTPSPLPDRSLDSPLMTWGQVCGTPLILNQSNGQGQTDKEDLESLALELGLGGASPMSTNFQIQAPGRREVLGHDLARTGKTSSKTIGHRERHSISRIASTGDAGSKKRKLSGAHLTPAAQSLASRLQRVSGGTVAPSSSPFGGLAQCRSLSQSLRHSSGSSHRQDKMNPSSTRSVRPKHTPVIGHFD